MKRAPKGPDEQDVHTSWRKLYIWTQRPGATAGVKRRTRRRERHAASARDYCLRNLIAAGVPPEEAEEILERTWSS